MNKNIFIALFFLCSLHVGAQKDSLWKVIRAAKTDTLQVMNYIQLGEAYEMTSPDSAVAIYKMAGDLSMKLNYPKGYCFYANAIAYPLELLDRLEEKDSILFRAIELCQEHGFQRELARKYHSLGISEQFRRNYERAIEWYLKGLTIVDQLHDTTLYTAFYNNLGTVFKGLGQNEKAYEYGERALAIHRARGRKSGIASALINLAILDVRALRYDKALDRYNEALKISEEIGDIEGLLICYINMSDVYLGKGENEYALTLIEKAAQYEEQLHSPRYRVMVVQAKASALKLLKRYRESLIFLKESQQLSMELGDKERLSGIFQDLSEVYEKLGDMGLALSSYKQYKLYADSVSNDKVESNANELEIRYQSERKERELLEKDFQIERQESQTRFQRILLICALVVIVLLSFFVIQRLRLNREKMRAAERAKQLELAEMREKERSRIAADMHDDIGSGLTSIRLLSEIMIHKKQSDTSLPELKRIADRSSELVAKLSEIIWAMNPANDSLENLVAYIRSYAATLLDEAQIELKFDSKIAAPETIVFGEFRRSVFLMVKEILNNTIKHAEANSVEIRIHESDKKLIIHLSDNGRGLNPETHDTKGNGISSLRKRTEALNGKMDFSGENGVRYEFELYL